MKKLLLLFILCANVKFLQAQPQFIKRMLFNKDSTRRPSFLFLPAISSSPESGVEFGASSLYSFYSDRSDPITRVSNIFLYASATTKGQQRLTLNSSYWLSKNRYHFTVNAGTINFPYFFYGIGNNTSYSDKERILQRRQKIDVSGTKKLGKYIYAGYVAGAFRYQFNIYNYSKTFENQLTPEDRSGGTGIYAGPALTFDRRNNNTYTTKGTIFTTYLNVMHGLYGNHNYQGAFFNAEFAKFFSLQKRLVLGVDVQEQSLFGNRAPFYLLPVLGNDEMMRGYYNGRYRDRNLIAGQIELRYRLFDRLAIAGFTGAGNVFHGTFQFDQLKPDYGGGLRYFFDTEKGLTIRADYGIGEKRTGEPRQQGFYLSLGEAF